MEEETANRPKWLLELENRKRKVCCNFLTKFSLYKYERNIIYIKLRLKFN